MNKILKIKLPKMFFPFSPKLKRNLTYRTKFDDVIDYKLVLIDIQSLQHKNINDNIHNNVLYDESYDSDDETLLFSDLSHSHQSECDYDIMALKKSRNKSYMSSLLDTPNTNEHTYSSPDLRLVKHHYSNYFENISNDYDEDYYNRNKIESSI